MAAVSLPCSSEAIVEMDEDTTTLPRTNELLLLRRDSSSYFALLARDIIEFYLGPYATVVRRTYTSAFFASEIRSHPDYNFITDEFQGCHLVGNRLTVCQLASDKVWKSYKVRPHTGIFGYYQIHNSDGKMTTARCSYEILPAPGDFQRQIVQFVADVDGRIVRNIQLPVPMVLSLTCGPTTIFYIDNHRNFISQPFDGPSRSFYIDNGGYREGLVIIGYSYRHQGPILYMHPCRNLPGEVVWFDSNGQIADRLDVPVQPVVFDTAHCRRIVYLLGERDWRSEIFHDYMGQQNSQEEKVTLKFIQWDVPCEYEYSFSKCRADTFTAVFDREGSLYAIGTHGTLMTWK